MAYQIDTSCVMCGACAEDCPVGAIIEGEGKFIIDESSCVDCGNCEGVCPVGAPIMVG